jgi:hypothetical protein
MLQAYFLLLYVNQLQDGGVLECAECNHLTLAQAVSNSWSFAGST